MTTYINMDTGIAFDSEEVIKFNFKGQSYTIDYSETEIAKEYGLLRNVSEDNVVEYIDSSENPFELLEFKGIGKDTNIYKAVKDHFDKKLLKPYQSDIKIISENIVCLTRGNPVFDECEQYAERLIKGLVLKVIGGNL